MVYQVTQDHDFQRFKKNPNRIRFILLAIMNDDLTTGILSTQVFDPKNRYLEGRILSASEGIYSELPIYHWPKDISNADKLNFLSYMTAFGRSEDESPTKWATWVYSFIVMCFPNMKELIRREGMREFSFKVMPAGVIQQISKMRDAALDFDGSGENREYDALVSELRFPADFPSLPRNFDSFPDVLAGCGSVHPVYGYCGLLIFLAGKKINERNVTTISERRPQNIIDTFSIPEEASHFLTGEFKMNEICHKMVNQAWVTHAPARKAIITDVASFAIGTSPPQRTVYVVSKMLENVGMQQAYYIHRFLEAFPQSKKYACIRPSWGVYASSIREVAKADSRIQPYYKVIYGDQTRAFHRNGLLTLAACAIAFERTTSPSMRNFTLGEGATAAIAMFDAEATRNGHQTLGDYANINDHALSAE